MADFTICQFGCSSIVGCCGHCDAAEAEAIREKIAAGQRRYSLVDMTTGAIITSDVWQSPEAAIAANNVRLILGSKQRWVIDDVLDAVFNAIQEVRNA